MCSSFLFFSRESVSYTHLEASDGKKIICSDSTNYCIDSIDAETGERTKLVDGSFLASHDGLIYYQPVEADSGAATKGKVSFAVVDAQGGQQKTLCTTEPDLYADDFQGTASIVSMVFKDEYIYFSYGSYAGTGSVYALSLIHIYGKTSSSDYSH